jgi:hypothetical protein
MDSEIGAVASARPNYSTISTETVRNAVSSDVIGTASGRIGKSTDPSYTRTTLFMRVSTHRALRAKAVALDAEMSELVERLIIAWLELDDVEDEDFIRSFSTPKRFKTK